MSLRQIKIGASITNREAQSLDKYLVEISRIKMISVKEEEVLASLIREGDKQALENLTKANLRFVVSVAKQYQGRGLSLSDLINEGNIGLITAAGRFDSSKGFKFISFAVWWIRQNILQALSEKSRTIRIPTNKILLKNRVYNAQTKLEQQLGRSPSTEEVAEILEIDETEISLVLLHHKTLSLDSPFLPGEDGTLLDTFIDPNERQVGDHMHHDESLKREIERSMQVLTERQKETVCYFFGIGLEHPMTLEDIGQKFDLTTERVRQIRDKALGKLRTTKGLELLRTYL